MNRITLSSGFFILGIIVLMGGCLSPKQEAPRKPFIFSGESGSIAHMDIDDLILESNLIAIGKFDSIPPSRWNTPDGTLPENATWNTIHEEGLFIYTEQIFQPIEILKIDPQDREILVRSFGGQVGEDITEVSSLDVVYTTEQEYLLFLSYYPDRSEDDTPGYYLASGSIQGVYKIVNEMAVSYRDEWTLDELVTYIQNSELSKVDVPDTPETREIIKQIETALDIEARCSFDFSIFPSVYVNHLRYPLDSEKLEFIRNATDNPSLETAGYLDYKLTYHSWWLEGKRQWEEIYTKAREEKRDISEEEQKAFLESKWGKYPGGYCTSKRTSQLRFISILVESDIATVVLVLGHHRPKELTLVFVEGQWYIAQEINI